ncbi:MAG: matrixin family metalloprotease [Planctomycetota bacterium]|nr:matrixin family metalloprotease [Planctomycetota bacterium]
MKFKNLLLGASAPILALGLATTLVTPEVSTGYSLIGGSLSHTQRDFRVYNNFTDAAANNNQTPDDQFPGYQGAVMAIWKATVEWGSELHGDGTGDPHQSTGLGSGGANFDSSFQGEATGTGGTNNNIHSELSGSSPGVLAYCETPISDGWRIRYYSNWNWLDGPGTSTSGGIDLQSVACHEFGHALGLGHSNTGGATMYPSILSGVNSRSIATDDQNGLKAIYGTKSSSKPRITGVSVSAGQITVTGTNFDSTGNQIWFTQAGSGGNGQPIKVTNLTSNGTTITASVPANAGPGDVLVRSNGTSHSDLSNAWPTDLNGSTGGGGAPTISGVSPSSIEQVVIDGPGLVTLTGSGFTGTSSLVVDGKTLSSAFPPEYNIVNDNTITFSMPLTDTLGPASIIVTNASGTTVGSISVVANAAPTIEMANSNPGFLFQALGLDLVVGGQPGDIAFVCGSPDLSPTIIPGIMDLGIGAGYTSLFILATPSIPAKGYVELNIPMAGLGLPSGFGIHVQTATLTLSTLYALPTVSSNVQSGSILF